jgi:hypothetical protein
MRLTTILELPEVVFIGTNDLDNAKMLENAKPEV